MCVPGFTKFQRFFLRVGNDFYHAESRVLYGMRYWGEVLRLLNEE